MVSKVSGGRSTSAPSDVKATPASKPAARAEATKKAPDSGFADKQKVKVKLTGTGNWTKGNKNSPLNDPKVAELAAKFAKSVGQAGPQPVSSLVRQAAVKPPSVRDAIKAVNAAPYGNRGAELSRQLERLSPQDQQRVWAGLSPEVRSDLSFGVTTGTYEQPSVVMLAVQNMTGKELGDLADQLRTPEKKIPAGNKFLTPAVRFAVATELAARTQWGKENPTLIAEQRQRIAQGDQVSFVSGSGAARTDEATHKVELDESLQLSPEALAATLAHESMHAEHAEDGGFDKSRYKEENAPNTAGAQIWRELKQGIVARGSEGEKILKAIQKKKLETLDDYASQLSPLDPNKKLPTEEPGVRARVGVEYAMNAVKSSDPGMQALAADYLKALADDPAALAKMKPEYVIELARIAVEHPLQQSLNVVAVLEKLPPAQRRAAKAAVSDAVELNLMPLPMAARASVMKALEG